MSTEDRTPVARSKPSRRYYKLSPDFWRDEKTSGWDDDARLCALYVLTSPHRTTEGLFYMPRSYAIGDLGWQAKRFNKAFDRLIADGFIEYDDKASVCWIVKAMDYQVPANPKQAMWAAKLLAKIPPNRMANRFRTVAETASKRLAEVIANDYPDAWPNQSPNGIANTPSSKLLAPNSEDSNG